MKYAAPIVAFAAVVAAQPAFTNTAFNIQEGRPFTLTFNGCQGGCSIILQNGPEDDLQDVRQLTSSASGGSFTVNLSNLPTDSYAFKIVNNASGEENYSAQFSYAGTGEPDEETTSSAELTTLTTTNVITTTSEVTTTSSSSEEETTTETSAETTVTESVTETTVTSSASVTASTTEAEDETTTTSDDPDATESSGIPDPDGAAGAIGAPLGLIAAAVAGLLFLQ